MGNTWSQFFVSDPPKMTEKDLPDQTGKVHIITGGYTGIGLSLAKLLYQKNATVYIAGRDKGKFDKAMADLANENSTAGRIEFIKLDLADQPSIKASADEFLKKESRLDVLVNNAGVMAPPAGSVDAQGHDLMMGTNVLGPWLFTQYLLPVLKSTASTAPPNSVRVVWLGSLLDFAEKRGVQFDEASGEPKLQSAQQNIYMQSKVANAFLASEFARRYEREGIVSVGVNPGNLNTELARHKSAIFIFLIQPLIYKPVLGAYTMLYAGWSSEIDMSCNGIYIWPFGRKAVLRPDLVAAMKSKDEGGTGEGKMMWEWCEKECGKYL